MEITKRLHSMRDTVTVQEKAYYAELAMVGRRWSDCFTCTLQQHTAHGRLA